MDQGSGSSGAANATDDGSAGDSTGAADETGDDSEDQGSPFDSVGPRQDPAPDADESGAYECAGCPTAMTDIGDLDVGASNAAELSGIAVGGDGHGRFYVEGPSGQFLGGMLVIDDNSSEFLQTIPLFCGESTVKMVFGNQAGVSAYVRKINRTGCAPAQVRVSLAWDETSEDWQLHLIRFGGSIQDYHTDCHDDFGCNGSIDWGVEDFPGDNPLKDMDIDYVIGGVENIVVPSGAEDGMTVVVDNVDESGGPVPSGIVYLNVGDQPTHVIEIDTLAPYHGVVVAGVDGAAGVSTEIGTPMDCAADWDYGCVGSLP